MSFDTVYVSGENVSRSRELSTDDFFRGPDDQLGVLVPSTVSQVPYLVDDREVSVLEAEWSEQHRHCMSASVLPYKRARTLIRSRGFRCSGEGGGWFAEERTPGFLPSPGVSHLTNRGVQSIALNRQNSNAHLIWKRQEVLVKQNHGAGYRQILRRMSVGSCSSGCKFPYFGGHTGRRTRSAERHPNDRKKNSHLLADAGESVERVVSLIHQVNLAPGERRRWGERNEGKGGGKRFHPGVYPLLVSLTKDPSRLVINWWLEGYIVRITRQNGALLS